MLLHDLRCIAGPRGPIAMLMGSKEADGKRFENPLVWLNIALGGGVYAKFAVTFNSDPVRMSSFFSRRVTVYEQHERSLP